MGKDANKVFRIEAVLPHSQSKFVPVNWAWNFAEALEMVIGQHDLGHHKVRIIYPNGHVDYKYSR